MSENKLKLWDAVSKTNPDYTKKVNQRGGYTAINAQYQIKQATEQWGSYGDKWGVRELEYGFFPSKEDPQEIYLGAIFYYPSGVFPIGVDMVYKAGNDSSKKLLTDLTTKALSKLGFSADVFLGMYDDNKYVTSLKKEKEEDEIDTRIRDSIRNAKSVGTLTKIETQLTQNGKDDKEYLDLIAAAKLSFIDEKLKGE